MPTRVMIFTCPYCRLTMHTPGKCPKCRVWTYANNVLRLRARVQLKCPYCRNPMPRAGKCKVCGVWNCDSVRLLSKYKYFQ